MTSTDSPGLATRPIDREALRRKYREERDKRLRPDGNAQYVQASGVFARYLDDPYTPSNRAPRRPITSPSPSSAADSPGW